MTIEHTGQGARAGQTDRGFGSGRADARPAAVQVRWARVAACGLCAGMLAFSGCAILPQPPPMEVVQIYDGPPRPRMQCATVFAKNPAFISKCGDREPEAPPSIHVQKRFKTFATSPGEGVRARMGGMTPGRLRPQVLELHSGPNTFVLNYADVGAISLKGRTVNVDLKPGCDYCITATREKMSFAQGLVSGMGIPQRFQITYHLTDADTGQIIESFSTQ